MPFPVSRTLTLIIDASYSEDDVLGDIERRLQSVGAKNVRRAACVLSFGVHWTTTAGPLFMVTSGEFALHPAVGSAQTQQLTCYLSFRRSAVAAILLSYGWLGIVGSLIEGAYTGGSLVGTLLFCTFGWCYLLGVWYLIIPPWLVRRLKLRRFEEAAMNPAPSSAQVVVDEDDASRASHPR
jgi:hypothetical protein